MSEPITIKINEVEYVRKDSISVSDTEIKIIVLDRGFVYVGKPSTGNDMLLIERARNIRQWGTTKGLAELINGPTNKTVLDATMTVRVPLCAVLQQIDVDQGSWKKYI